jgi:hypothetical protein
MLISSDLAPKTEFFQWLARKSYQSTKMEGRLVDYTQSLIGVDGSKQTFSFSYAVQNNASRCNFWKEYGTFVTIDGFLHSHNLWSERHLRTNEASYEAFNPTDHPLLTQALDELSLERQFEKQTLDSLSNLVPDLFKSSEWMYIPPESTIDLAVVVKTKSYEPKFQIKSHNFGRKFKGSESIYHVGITFPKPVRAFDGRNRYSGDSLTLKVISGMHIVFSNLGYKRVHVHNIFQR